MSLRISKDRPANVMRIRGKPEYVPQPIAYQHNPFSSLGHSVGMGIDLFKSYVVAERQQRLHSLADVLAVPRCQKSLNIFHEEPFGAQCRKDTDVLG